MGKRVVRLRLMIGAVFLGSCRFSSGLVENDILEAWNSGDIVLQDLLKYQAKVLGIAIANIVNITGVERIIVGGHFYHVLENQLLHIVDESANKHAIGDGMKGVNILLNKLGPEAPALGATLL